MSPAVKRSLQCTALAMVCAMLASAWFGTRDSGITWTGVFAFATLCACSAIHAFQRRDSDRRALARVVFAASGIVALGHACVLLI